MMQVINTRQAANLLEVSEATVRNWVRHGFISPVADRPRRFAISAVETLKQRIAAGEIDRLRRRANKKKTSATFIPDEYIDHRGFSAELATIRAIFLENTVDIDNALFALTLKQLVLRGEVAIACGQLFATASWQACRRKTVANELADWARELPPRTMAAGKACTKLFCALTNAAHDDTIGIIYQSLLQAGSKATQGSFYTPTAIIDDIFKDHAGRDGLFLDPCCGTGQFLLRAARHGYSDPNRLYGIDSDRRAVRIARINLLLAFPEAAFPPQVYHADTLLQNDAAELFNTPGLNRKFAMIATNPPWGASFADADLKLLRQRYPAISSCESFSYFLTRSLELAENGAVISFILPESILNIRVHSDIRRHILANSQVLAIHSLERPFKNVFTPAIRLDLLNTAPCPDWPVNLKKPDGTWGIASQTRFTANSDQIFDIAVSDTEHGIIERLYSIPHLTLRNNADWALGIVTGDNRRYLSAVAEDGMEPVYRGRDVMPYRLQPATSFIRFNPSVFQQVAPTARYRVSEKLIYRFISNRLVFAYDDRQALPLNSANILVPRLPEYPVKAVLCLLNSKLLQFVFARKFNTHKVLRGNLEQLPIPLFTEKILRELVALADCAIRGKPVAEAIDAVIFKSLNFSKTEIDLILSGIALK